MNLTRDAELIIKMTGVEGKKSVASPGVKNGDVKDEEGDDEELMVHGYDSDDDDISSCSESS